MGKRGWRPPRRVFPLTHAADYINVTQAPDRDKMQLLYKGHVRSVRGRAGQMEPVENNTFLQKIPPTKGRLNQTYFDGEGGVFRTRELTPREDKTKRNAQLKRTVMEYLAAGKYWAMSNDRSRLLKLWQSENGSKWGIDTYHHFKVTLDGGVKLFFCGPIWLLVETIGDRAWRSINYRSKERALWHLQHACVQWSEEIYILPAAAPFPSKD